MISYLQAIQPKFLEHVIISCAALSIAILIGVPLGAMIRQVRWLRGPVLGMVNVFQTLPSLALLAILIPMLGIGIKPTLVVLCLYALLPIVRNTYTGLTNIPKSCIESANGLGFSASQRLRIIEFPLAWPVILAGIRTATAMTVGITTIASLIGAGGLGDFITQGLALNDSALILLGAVPTAVLALCLDFVLAQCEHQALQYKEKYPYHKIKTGISIVLVLLLTGFCGQQLWKNWQGSQINIVVGSKNFTESVLMGEMIAQVLEAETDFRVVRKFNLGTTAILHEALLKNYIDMYPEYTGTGLKIVLKNKKRYDRSQLWAYLNREYRDRYGLTWLAPLGFSNTNVLAVQDTLAQENNLETISDLARLAPSLVIAAPAEFIHREDAMPLLRKDYGLTFKNIIPITPELTYQALMNGDAQVIQAFSTDGRLSQYEITSLVDDRNIFPPYDAAIVIKRALLSKYPELRQVLERLTNKINEAEIQELNYQLETSGDSPRAVAKSFLRQKNIIRE